MSNATIYYGAPTKAGQSVSAEVRSRGLNLLRSSPTDAFPTFFRSINTIQYINYTENLGAAFQAAIEDKYVYVKQTRHFYKPARSSATVFMRPPTIVWNYADKMSPDSLSSLKERFNAAESVAQGKPALIATLSLSQIKSLVDDTNPNDKTPASTTTINIGAARVYLRLHRLADLFLRTHQYPLSLKQQDGQHNYFRDAFELQMKDALPKSVTVGSRYIV